jgi:hypothetical protein
MTLKLDGHPREGLVVPRKVQRRWTALQATNAETFDIDAIEE